MDKTLYSAENVLCVWRYLFEEGRALSESVQRYVDDYGLHLRFDVLPPDVVFEYQGFTQVVRCFPVRYGYALATDKPYTWCYLMRVSGVGSQFHDEACVELLSRVRYRESTIQGIINVIRSLNDSMRSWLEQVERQCELLQADQLEQRRQFQELLLLARLAEKVGD